MESRLKFQIPLEFQDQIRFQPTKDTRSDEEILQTLTRHEPVTSEKNIWAYWHSGVMDMPSWCQRNICDWFRLNNPSGWVVHILDSLPDSPNNSLNFVPLNMLPQSFVEGNMDGPHVGPHSSDFLRGACLYLHGGVYMDVGNLEIRELDRICWKQLEDPDSPFQVSIPWMYGLYTANHFVAARKGDPFIKRWHDLFTHIWIGHTNHQGTIDNPLFACLADTMSFDDSRASNFHWNFKVDAKTVMEYIGQVLCWCRISMLDNPENELDGFSGIDYWTKKVLIFDVLQENWGAEAVLGFSKFGEKMLAALCTPLDADPDSQQYKDAHNMTWRLLTESSIEKITHGKGLTEDVHVGYLLDMAENEECDRKEGTFAELLRYGSINFKQTREEIRYVQAPRPKTVLKKGLLEP